MTKPASSYLVDTSVDGTLPENATAFSKSVLKTFTPLRLPGVGLIDIRAILFLPFFLLLFATNSRILGLFVIFPIAFSCYLMILLFGGPIRNIEKRNIYTTSIIYYFLIFLMIDKTTFTDSYDDYYIWPFLLVFSWGVMVFLRDAPISPLMNHIVGAAITFFSLKPFFQDADQVTALFGANVLYRIELAWFGLIVWTALKQRKFLIILIAFGVGLWLTDVIQSRAGQIIFLIMSGAYTIAFFTPKLSKFLPYFAFAGMAFSILNLQQVFLFLKVFDINLSIFNGSEAYRLLLTQRMLNLDFILHNHMSIGEIYYAFGAYPHSIIVEAFGYHSIYFGIFTVIIVGFCFVRCLSHPSQTYLLPILMGPLFSGDMQDNYVVYLIALHFILDKDGYKFSKWLKSSERTAIIRGHRTFDHHADL